MPQYLLDANFFIQSNNRNYPLDVVISFWEKIELLVSNGIVVSIDKVKNEIDNEEDILKNWCADNLPSGFFYNSIDVVMSGMYGRVINDPFMRPHQYNQKALDDFMSDEKADAWLIAHAMQHGLTLVTYEVRRPGSIAIIKIPDICDKIGVRCIEPLEMFRELNLTI